MSDQVSLCDSIEPLLGDYADGEVVSAADKARIESHLQSCPHCTSEIAFLRATNFVVSSRYPDVQPPVDLFVRTALATYNRPTLRARVAGWFAPMPVRLSVGSAVATAVVVVAVVPISRSHFGGGAEAPAATSELSRTHSAMAKTEGSSRPPKSVVASRIPKTSGQHPILAVAAKTAPAITPADSARIHAGVTLYKPTSRPSDRIATNAAPVVPARNLPAIINRVKLAPVVIPAIRETELSRRGDFQRTLANGDLPKEFPAPKTGVPIEEYAAPARIAALTSPSATTTESSPAHSVVEPPPIPRGLHISLGGAGSSRLASIQLKNYRGSGDASYALVSAPIDEKTDTDESAKNASHGKIP